MRYVFILILFLLMAADLKAQGELDNQRRILYRNERTFGAFLGSNGYGADFTYATRINARNHTLYRVELGYKRHPKEVRLSNSFYSNRSFVFGKTNNFFELKGHWGRSSELFRKNDAGGVSIRYFYSFGPNIGILKPIYYEIIYLTPDLFTQVEKFDPSTHQSNIYGRASFFEGINEISIVPGISAKMGFTFEYSRRDLNINALELGAGFDLYPREIPIMATENNNFFFLNFYVGYRFGKAIDISDAARSQRSGAFERMRERREQRKNTRDSNQNPGSLDPF